MGVLHITGNLGLRPETYARIRDGTSETWMVGEYQTRTHPGRRTYWAYSFGPYNTSDATPQARTLLPDYDACVAQGDGTLESQNPCKRGWASFHPGGMNFLCCDGAVHFVSRSVNLEVFCEMATIAGRETPTAPW
jgi:hypothetical protein